MILHHLLFTSKYQPLGTLQTQDGVFFVADEALPLSFEPSFLDEFERWQKNGVPARSMIREETETEKKIQTIVTPIDLESPDFVNALTQWVLQQDHRTVTLPETHFMQAKKLLQLGLEAVPQFDFLRALALTPADQLETWSAGLLRAGMVK